LNHGDSNLEGLFDEFAHDVSSVHLDRKLKKKKESTVLQQNSKVQIQSVMKEYKFRLKE